MTLLSLKASKSPTAKLLLGLIGSIILLAGWHLSAVLGIYGNGLPTVTATFAQLGQLLTTSSFWQDVGMTIGIALLGLAISLVIGVTLGVLIGSFEPVRAATFAITEFLKPIPPIVVLPLAVMIWGPTSTTALFLVLVGCVLAISIQTIAGVLDADPVAQATARSYGLGRLETLFNVTLPGALPFIGTAVRVSAPASLIVVVVAGLIGGAPGLGRSLYQAQASGDYPLVYALVVVLGVLGLSSQWLSEFVESKVLAWHPSFRKETH
ncbi:ABC transporter permease [Micrococcoides hystricis]|uniref:ABC transporter permease n=1 Tax=Micrococcoides hystricis TaxID=1572761 RepID=A0ABV6PC76_9MICC